jgi:hypothetical protein
MQFYDILIFMVFCAAMFYVTAHWANFFSFLHYQKDPSVYSEHMTSNLYSIVALSLIVGLELGDAISGKTSVFWTITTAIAILWNIRIINNTKKKIIERR